MINQQHRQLYARINHQVENAIYESVGQGFTHLTIWSPTKYCHKLSRQQAIDFFHRQFQKRIDQETIITRGLRR